MTTTDSCAWRPLQSKVNQAGTWLSLVIPLSFTRSWKGQEDHGTGEVISAKNSGYSKTPL